ncbi:hypothetical protein ACIRRI_39480 [Streptomyces mirabilis]|uniref:hypothetical protein n=1 Tax=Streptomyces mirabilis TaxID=68239 RepID=UPI00380DC43E
MTLLAAAVVAGTAVGAFAADGAPTTGAGTGPQIVSSSEYATEGGVDPQSMAPIGEVAPAQGIGVEKLTDLLMKTTRLDLFQAPGVEECEKVGQTLTFSLGDGNAEHPLNITRLTVHGDVPSSVLWAEGDEMSTTTLSDGSQLLTAVGKEGTRVSTLSKDGLLTLWEAPLTSAQHTYSTEDLVRWATTVDEQGITASHAPGLTAARAEPHCQLTKSRKPYLHGGVHAHPGRGRDALQSEGQGELRVFAAPVPGARYLEDQGRRGLHQRAGPELPGHPALRVLTAHHQWLGVPERHRQRDAAQRQRLLGRPQRPFGDGYDPLRVDRCSLTLSASKRYAGDGPSSLYRS